MRMTFVTAAGLFESPSDAASNLLLVLNYIHLDVFISILSMEINISIRHCSRDVEVVLLL